MKKINIIMLLTIIILLVLANRSFANIEKFTMEELKENAIKVLEKDEEKIISSKIEENKVIIILEENIELELFYNQENNTFYSEYSFYNGMSEKQFEKEFYSMIESPYLGFMAYAEKKEIEHSIYYQYAFENGLMTDSMGIQFGFESNKDSDLSITENLNNFFSEEILETLSYDNDYYLKTITKKMDNSNVILRSSLTLKDGDYSKIADYIKDKTIFISPETAEIYAKIKVGESYKISLEGVSGYSSSGGTVKFSNDYSEVVGVKQGITRGYIYGSDKAYTFYFEVEESNTSKSDDSELDNQPEDDKNDASKLDNGKSDDNQTDEDKENDSNSKEIKAESKKDYNDATVVKDAMLPQTGSNQYVLLFIIPLLIIIYNTFKLYSYKDLN